MRVTFVRGVAALVGFGALIASARASAEPALRGEPGPASDDRLSRARALDREGARAYAEGRYHDAIQHFEASYRQGGPSFELWNIARCYARIDDPQRAASMLERYLATPLTAKDREEAEGELAALRRRPSVLTVVSTPMGADVRVDGKSEGLTTPASVALEPGDHVVVVEKPGHPPLRKVVVAHLGRAVIVDASLGASAPASGASAAFNLYFEPRIAMRALVGVAFPRYGQLAGAASPTVAIHGLYRFARSGPVVFGAGAWVSYGRDTWKDTVAATPPPECAALSQQTSASTFSVMGLLAASIPFARRFEGRAIAGGGVAVLDAAERGGNLFFPTCRASASTSASLLVGMEFDWAVTSALRVTAMPVAFQLQEAARGARSSDLWFRPILALGLGVDF